MYEYTSDTPIIFFSLVLTIINFDPLQGEKTIYIQARPGHAFPVLYRIVYVLLLVVLVVFTTGRCLGKHFLSLSFFILQREHLHSGSR